MTTIRLISCDKKIAVVFVWCEQQFKRVRHGNKLKKYPKAK